MQGKHVADTLVGALDSLFKATALQVTRIREKVVEAGEGEMVDGRVLKRGDGDGVGGRI